LIIALVTPQNKKFFGRLTQEDKALGRLMRPSWLSGLLVVVVSLVIVVGAVVAMQFRSSDFHYLYQLQNQKPQAVANNYQTLNNGVTSNALISDIPLILLWGGIGLIVYWCTMSLIRAYRSVGELEMELNYVHANRQELIHQTVWTVLVRIVVLLSWFLYLQATVHLLIPYAVAIGYAASGANGVILGAAYMAWGVGLLSVVLHIHVVLLRLLFLRPRLFGNG
ncbi:MAG TPA: hypothetical protein VF401_00785, partial [Candidatus Saccharimonadales bacterium]